ncbi:MAG: DUF1573 domain-containing protein [Candidatus Zixiibacteriota bacterium]
MKFVFSSSLAGLVIVMATVSLAGPAVEIPEPEFDFGRVYQKSKIAHTFWVKSAGDDTLRIVRIVPGCGCTQAPIEDSVIAPGDSTALEIFFTSRSYRGPVAKRPYFETNTGDEKYYVRIKIDLIPDPDTLMPITLNPYTLDVSQFTTMPRRRAKFLIQNKSDREYRLELIDWSKKHFDVTLPGKVKAGETVQGLVTVHEDMVDSEFEQSLTFQINDENNTRYTLPVKRMVRIKDVAGK